MANVIAGQALLFKGMKVVDVIDHDLCKHLPSMYDNLFILIPDQRACYRNLTNEDFGDSGNSLAVQSQSNFCELPFHYEI